MRLIYHEMTNDNNKRSDSDKRTDYGRGVDSDRSVDSGRNIHSVNRTEDNSSADSYKKN